MWGKGRVEDSDFAADVLDWMWTNVPWIGIRLRKQLSDNSWIVLTHELFVSVFIF